MRSEPDSIGSYLPRMLLGWLPQPPKGPATRTLSASVLSVDISGFTHLTERLVEQESAGIERLSAILNGFYGELIRVVESYGGELMTIVGDGVLSTFPAPAADELLGAVERAACCGLELGRVLDGYQPDPGSVLRVRTGLGAGSLVVARLGQAAQWELTVGGDAVSQAVAADRRAAPGTFAVSEPAWDHLRAAGRGRSLPEHFVELFEYARTAPLSERGLPMSLEHSEMLSYLPLSVRARVSSSAPSWQSELRHITVAFFHLRTEAGSNVDIEHAQESVALLQNISAQFGGGFDKLIFDDKGTVATVVFGLPPHAHEDDPRRAVSAAVEAHEQLAALGIVADIGVATGRAFWGPIGAPSRRQYCLIGGVMNLGARLMQGARNEVLCCPRTRSYLAGQIEGDDLGARELKGFQHRIPVYRARATSAPPSSLPATLGRIEERRRLATLVENAKHEQGGFFWIEAEPGLGKSALVADLETRARVAGARMLLAAGDSIEQTTPYHAFRKTVSSLLDLARDASKAERTRQVKERVDQLPAMAGLSPLLSPILGLPLLDTPASRILEGQVRADRTAELIVLLLEAYRRKGPIILALEDLHWFDSASLRLAASIHKRMPQTPVVATTRPVRVVDEEDFATLRSEAEHIRLSPLPESDIMGIVLRKLGARAVSSDAARFIQERAEGNPFFAESLSRELLASHFLLLSEGLVTLKPGAEWEENQLPRSLDAIIGSRIDRLDPRVGLTLKTASVVGRTFAVSVVHAVHPDAPDEAEFDASLRDLEEHGLVLPVEGLGTYTFDHAVTHEVTYARMPNFQREELHRRIADHYERAFAGELSAHYPLLAHHHERARNAARAVDLLDLSAEQAFVSGAFRETVRFLERALSLAAEIAVKGSPFENVRLSRFHRMLGESLDALGDRQRMATHARLSLALLGYPEPEGLVAQVESITRDGLAQAGLSGLAFSMNEAALPPEKVAFELSRAYQILGTHYFFALAPLGMVTSILRATTAAELAGRPSELGKCYSGMALILGVAGQRLLARRYAERAVVACAHADDAGAATRGYVMAALYFVGAGDFDQSSACSDQAERLALPRGDYTSYGEALAIRAWSFVYRGRHEAVAGTVRQLKDAARRAENDQLAAWAKRFEAAELLSAGRYEEARTLFREALDVVGRQGDEAERLLVNGSLCLALVRNGEHEAALKLLREETRDLLSRFGHPTSHIVLEGVSDLLEALVELMPFARGAAGADETPLLLRCREDALVVLGRYRRGFPIGRARFHHFKGALDLERGHRVRARFHFSRGLSAAKASSLPADEARLRRDLEQLSGSTRRHRPE